MISNQAILFFIFIVNGLIIGLLFDFFRILRKTFDTNDIVTYIEDFIFWILTGAVILYSIFTFNNGEIRLFMFLGIIIGLTIYMLCLSNNVIKINVFIFNILKNIILKIIHVILIPFKFIISIIKKIKIKTITFRIFNLKNWNRKKYNIKNV